MSYDQRGSELLGDDECKRLLAAAAASGHTGRLAVGREGSPYVIPVNFSYYEEMILIRLGPGFAAHHLDGASVTFEIDDAEPYGRKGWSVLVEGHATLMTYEEIARLGRNIPRPIVTLPGVRVFSLRPETISGRSIHKDQEPTSSDVP
jgi:nitroimidazol reductase NimA-like FMN-containing flavoprotein (pyridoxamine 5'-phosphate oxidase superfamily)